MRMLLAEMEAAHAAAAAAAVASATRRSCCCCCRSCWCCWCWWWWHVIVVVIPVHIEQLLKRSKKKRFSFVTSTVTGKGQYKQIQSSTWEHCIGILVFGMRDGRPMYKANARTLGRRSGGWSKANPPDFLYSYTRYSLRSGRVGDKNESRYMEYEYSTASVRQSYLLTRRFTRFPACGVKKNYLRPRGHRH
jgi:hypothetical protein